MRAACEQQQRRARSRVGIGGRCGTIYRLRRTTDKCHESGINNRITGVPDVGRRRWRQGLLPAHSPPAGVQGTRVQVGSSLIGFIDCIHISTTQDYLVHVCTHLVYIYS